MPHAHMYGCSSLKTSVKFHSHDYAVSSSTLSPLLLVDATQNLCNISSTCKTHDVAHIVRFYCGRYNVILTTLALWLDVLDVMTCVLLSTHL